jgi:hypothetical protein
MNLDLQTLINPHQVKDERGWLSPCKLEAAGFFISFKEICKPAQILIS